jgi:hypothetical protein
LKAISSAVDIERKIRPRQVRYHGDMTTLGHAALRKVALKVLSQYAGSSAGSSELAAAAQRAYDNVARVSAPLIGQGGVDALTARALHLAQREYPWLTGTRGPEQSDASFAHAILSLERQDPVVAVQAAGAVFAAFTGLLVTFIGESLTVRLLRQAWPDAFFDADTEEIKA